MEANSLGSEPARKPGQTTGVHDEHPEAQPLLNNNHRTLGESSANGPTVNEGRDIESDGFIKDSLFQLRKGYRIFIHNSKWILNILILINTIWLITTLISDFFFNINILFGFSNRYASFNDLILIFISIIANSFNLWFNKLGLYSALDYSLNVTLCALTLFNLALTYMIKYTRQRIGFVGTFTYLWTSFSFFVGAILDWYLLFYNSSISEPLEDRRIDEETTTTTTATFNDNNANVTDSSNRGRYGSGSPTPTRRSELVQNKHTLTEWVSIGFRNTVKFAILIFFGLFTLNTLLTTLDTYRLTHKLPVSVQSPSYEAFHYVDAAKTYQLHITCYGDVFDQENDTDPVDKKKQPIILFEHGGYDTGYLSATWIEELYHLDKIQRYCLYDRPGYGLSDSPPAPISIAMVAESLRYALIKDAKIKGPFTTVGYDLGGLFTRVFTAKNVDIVDSMMLVESWHEELLLKNYIQRLLPPGRGDGDDDDDDNRDGRNHDKTWLPSEIERHNEFKLWWKGIWSSLGWRLQTSWLLAHHGSKERIYGRDMRYQGRFLRSKFLESVTSSILSYRDVTNNVEALQNVKTSIVSSKEMVKKISAMG
ncbi:YNL115C-like protein [Saccharomyces cerevisiae x Saccharomyces kudriavzevii VIN7]|uniref:YNL115C-like protein n=1 Tax=Saccharomyces cerevisiae x Saccharomyces kudriavzevii (strain VIN7) TaxID=1095631 RepID=H0H076_SACCK|nr:YNL115C-like protein [Saccharomyces cerevisiae x Saccharomyces kudriavzevii VIN7]